MGPAYLLQFPKIPPGPHAESAPPLAKLAQLSHGDIKVFSKPLAIWFNLTTLLGSNIPMKSWNPALTSIIPMRPDQRGLPGISSSITHLLLMEL